MTRRRQLERTIAEDVVNTREQLDTKRRALDTTARQVDLARSILELVRAQYAAGTATRQLITDSKDITKAQDQLKAALKKAAS